ncbi:MAG TPA: ABC transporter permease [Planctomycetota bacterium]|nr:ABC transporter permease [Planctomycetota bacterium]
MWTYILRRLLQCIPVIIGVALIAFILSLLSGTPIRGMLPQTASPELVRKMEEYYGFNKPPHERFISYMGSLARGDLGSSMTHHGLPVSEMITSGMAVTLKLALGAMIVAVILGGLSGILSAWRPHSLVDYGSSFFAAVGISFPAFFLAMLFLLVFAEKLKWFPIGGYEAGNIRYLILPCTSLGLIMTASIARLTRNCLLETLSQDYIRTARSKGVAEAPVLLGHGLPNAMVPVVTVIGNDFASLLVGAVLTETIYQLPGIGTVIYNAIFSRDLPVIMGCCVFFALVFVVINLVVDITYAFLDPRIRYGD